MIFLPGYMPKNHAGSRYDANSDFVCRGGMLMISRLILPSATCWNASAIFSWCQPWMKRGQTYFTNAMKSDLTISLVTAPLAERP